MKTQIMARSSDHASAPPTDLPDSEHVTLPLLPHVPHDEGVGGRVATRDERLIVPHVAYPSDPIHVQLWHGLEHHVLGMLSKSL